MNRALRETLLLAALVVASQYASAQDVAAAAGARQPLYEFVLQNVDPGTGKLRPEAMTLPDEPMVRRFSRFRWAPGAFDGVGTHHMEWDGAGKALQAAQLLEQVATGDRVAEQALYELLRADDVVTFYNDALDIAAGRIRDVEPHLRGYARRLVTESPQRGPVKFGIALLGSMGDATDVKLIETLALHDEFGLYAAEALAEIAPERQQALLRMAQRVTGWGRIQAVERMVVSSDPKVRQWLLTEGFRNTVMAQYLAYHCATIADLKGALSEPRPDTQLLIGAADLLQALVTPGPAKGLDDYDDAAEASRLFLKHIEKRRESVSFYLAAQALRDYLENRETRGADTRWSLESTRDIDARARKIAADPRWRERVLAIAANDAADLDQTEAAAKRLGIDTFDIHVRRLQANPLAAQRWTQAFRTAGATRVERVLTIADRTFKPGFDKRRVARAPGDATEIAALEAVLQGLVRYPGAGMPLVSAALKDVDDRTRRAAVDTLGRWGGGFLTRNPPVRAVLSAAAEEEADELLKARMFAILNVD